MRAHRRTFLVASAAVASGLGAGLASAQEADAMTIGATDAPLHLTEYASATCPHCAHFHADNWSRLKGDYIDAGRVRYTLREMLTPPASVAFFMFQLARCNGADAPEYFRRLAILFARQQEVLSSGTMAGVRDALIAIGAEWGITGEQVMASLTDENGAERIQRSLEEARNRGVTGTPAFFIGDERINDPAFHTPEGMTALLNARLAGR